MLQSICAMEKFKKYSSNYGWTRYSSSRFKIIDKLIMNTRKADIVEIKRAEQTRF